MKKIMAATMTFLATVALSAEPRQQVTVCRGGVDASEIAYAQDAARKMFATIGMEIVWRAIENCPADALQVRFKVNAPPTEEPRALAYALPFEGTHIIVFVDRVLAAGNQMTGPKLMAHVIVHEITHILEGFSLHAQTGIMKAHWSADDICNMGFKPLRFEEHDLQLIQSGLRFKADRAATHALAQTDRAVAVLAN